jgi:hypothetical protein
MKPASEDIKDIFIESSNEVGEYAAASGWSIHIGGLASSPDTCISITDSPGLPPNPNFSDDIASFQVLVRGARGKYLDTWAKAKEIQNLLNGYRGSLSTTRYISIFCQGDVGFVYWDDNRRPIFSVNFNAERTE